MEDFEKGLMLAGLISPNNTCELEERTAVQAYEEQLNQKKGKIYFKRVVLAAEIAHQLYAEPTFGRVKFQKLVYLCEHAAEMDLQSRYKKLAAGPFDNKFMHTIETEFKRNKWFDVKKLKEGRYTRSVYYPLENVLKYQSYYTLYFPNESASIARIIELFRSAKTDIAEIAATLYACRLELFTTNQPVKFENILSLFYDWSIEKERFDRAVVQSVWKWMVEKELIEDVDK